jgi:hypothetical protein
VIVAVYVPFLGAAETSTTTPLASSAPLLPSVSVATPPEMLNDTGVAGSNTRDGPHDPSQSYTTADMAP